MGDGGLVGTAVLSYHKNFNYKKRAVESMVFRSKIFRLKHFK